MVPVISDRLRRSIDPGTTVLVSTVDTQGAPWCARGIALTSSDDLQTLTVYVPMATAQQLIQHAAVTHRFAVAATHPFEHLSIQLKGSITNTRIARDDEKPFVQDRLLAAADALDEFGIPRRLARSMSHWPAFAVEMRVEEIFDQTPGPKAGSKLR